MLKILATLSNLKKFIFSFLIIINIQNLNAQTTYYIDATGGNDSNNGITPQTAWRSLNKVNNYSFNTTSGNVYVRLKKGQVWRETLTPSRGGTGENNRVIFCSYGTGRRPQILGSNDLKSDISIWTDMGSNVWRRSLSSSPFYVIFEKPNTATNWGYIQSSSSACNSDYKFYYSSGYLYVYSVGNPASYYDKIEAPARAFAVGEITVRYITLDSLEIWGSQEACVRTSNGHYLTIQNCDIHHVGNVSVRDGGQGDLLYIISSNAVVRNNRIWEPGSHGIYQGMYNGYVGRNCLYEGNYIANCYYTMIDIQHTGSAGSTYGNAGGHIIRNNYLIGDSMAQGSIYNGAGAGIQVLGMRENGQNEWMKNIRIYNNVLVGMQWGINWTRVADSIQVYNNTFIDTDILMRETREDGWPSVSGYYTPPTKIWWKNNIVYRSSGSLISISNDTNKVFDNNLWYSSSGSPFNSGGSSRNFTQWKSWIKGDNNSVFANPMFVQYTNKSSAKDLRLQSTSPAINIGATLGVPYDRDKNGISRPQGNGYDAGAYEYTESSSGGGGGGTDITPPELQMAVLKDSTTLVIEFSENMDKSSTENISNYSISNGVSVLTASLINTVVTLSTTAHLPGNYIVTVKNVKDLSGNNIDTGHNSASYQMENVPIENQMSVLTVKKVIASEISEVQHTPEKTIDGKGYYQGDPDSRWAGLGMPQWLVYDLGKAKVINALKLSFYNWNNGRLYHYSVQVSNDSLSWNTIVNDSESLPQEWTTCNFSTLECRYIKIIFLNNTENSWAGLWEIEILGKESVSDVKNDNSLPEKFALEQNYPNPFNPSTKIKFEIPSQSNIKLKVFNILGAEVAELVNETKTPGQYEVEFNAQNLSSGVYFYTLQTENFIQTKKMILLK